MHWFFYPSAQFENTGETHCCPLALDSSNAPPPLPNESNFCHTAAIEPCVQTLRSLSSRVQKDNTTTAVPVQLW